MIVRLMLVLSIAGISSIATAANCYKTTVGFSDPCAGDAPNLFKTARANCNSGLLVTAGGSTAACQSPNALVSNIASLCANQCVSPPTIYTAGVNSIIKSYEPDAVNPNLVKVTWEHVGKDTMSCTNQTYRYIAVIDKSASVGASFFASYPVPDPSKYVSASFTCGTNSTTYTSANVNGVIVRTISQACVLSSFGAGSAPSAYCMIP